MFVEGGRIGDLEIVRELGRGGMAVLYLARRSSDGCEVAVKVMHREIAGDAEVRKMFLDEGRLSACIRHPNVVRVDSLGEHEGWPYLVMEHIRGATLGQILRARAVARAPLTIPIVIALAAQIADALHAAHESVDELGRPLGIVHRDVSPSNVLVNTDGRVKLIDFGIARARTRLAKTTPGSVKGKLAYMAPEQLAGAHIDRRGDVFALGIVLWESLVLRRLFHRTTDPETILAIRDRAPVPAPSTLRPDVPPRLDDVAATMLARDVDERFSTTAAARYAMLATSPEALHVSADALAALVRAAAEHIEAEEPTVPAGPRARGR